MDYERRFWWELNKERGELQESFCLLREFVNVDRNMDFQGCSGKILDGSQEHVCYWIMKKKKIILFIK